MATRREFTATATESIRPGVREESVFRDRRTIGEAKQSKRGKKKVKRLAIMASMVVASLKLICFEVVERWKVGP